MEHNCERHTFEVADGVCRSCQGSFCVDCLIYPFGPKQEPLCKPCAIAVGGIRSTAGNPKKGGAVEGTKKQKAKAKTKADKPKGSSTGLLGRLRRDQSDEPEERELTDEERIELEAAEARELLDAQRLPSQDDAEPEPEPLPTPNIAPPGRFDEERELAHRTMPDEIAGGLDLSRATESGAEMGFGTESPSPTFGDTQPETVPMTHATHGADTADATPDWARPEAAESENGTVAPQPGPAEPAGWRPDALTVDTGQGEPAATAWADVDDGANSDPTDRAKAEPAQAARPAPEPAPPPTTMPDPGPAPAPEPAPAPAPDLTTPVAPEPVATADGVPLFTQSTLRPDDLLQPVADHPLDAEPHVTHEPVPTAVGGSNPPAEELDDTSELLRRIADLRGR